ncbi:cysteine-rich secretory protein family domain-containing protein [Ditylenchus destructor]|uniref:Cysteine-rich secretory protein family domain-containing protein n=1 Tax=Ditylenchus destructor TaxID=166010 RepID=A0AAD4QWM0_9BILA|nr:cysteine-rich secretory protein family domain-containing protein [Ditylenchus destructor]
MQIEISGWWREQAKYGFYTPNQVFTAENLKCDPDCNGTIGHWSAIAWETTREFGCGVAQCPNGSIRTGPDPITYVVCRYNPIANRIGERVYISGPPCTATTGCVNSPASTCDVSTSLCFVSDAPKTTASPKTTVPTKTTTQRRSGSQLSVNKPVYKSGPPCTKTSGCVNTPASTCDVESSLCFVGGVPASGK